MDELTNERLSEAGYKLTVPRRRILAALQSAKRALTAQEVAALADTSVASTYRVLALLVELGVVGETPDLSGESGDGPGDDAHADATETANTASSTSDHHGESHHLAHRIEGSAGDGEARGRRYKLCSASGHHHHFVCRSCHALIEVRCDALERALDELAHESGLAVEHHEVLLSGLCGACRARNAAAHATRANERPIAPASASSGRRVEA